MRRLAALIALTALLACQAAEPPPASAVVDIEAVVAEWRRSVASLSGRAADPELAASMRGRYVREDGAVFEVVVGEAGAYARTAGVAMAPVRLHEAFISIQVPGPDGFASHDWYEPGPGAVDLGGHNATVLTGVWQREPGARPSPVAADLERVLGVYLPTPGRDEPTRLYLHQWEGQLWLQIGHARMIPASVEADGLRLGDNTLGLDIAVWSDGPDGTAGFELGGTTYRREFGVRAGPTFRIDPVRPVEELRAEAMVAVPPAETGEFRDPELVELVDVVPGLALDIRYASTNNFMGAVFYAEPRAFLQAPAAEALAGVQERLAEHGLGLLIYDAYRPWFATKMFWDATPESDKHFVANPANGSRHNRGSAVDLTLVDLATGEPVEMSGGYDEFTERSYPFFPGGTDRQRWHRALLWREMEAAGFAIYEYEWWHFDYRNWAEYPILDLPFDSLETAR